jgi:hypothetical protein
MNPLHLGSAACRSGEDRWTVRLPGHQGKQHRRFSRVDRASQGPSVRSRQAAPIRMSAARSGCTDGPGSADDTGIWVLRAILPPRSRLIAPRSSGCAAGSTNRRSSLRTATRAPPRYSASRGARFSRASAPAAPVPCRFFGRGRYGSQRRARCPSLGARRFSLSFRRCSVERGCIAPPLFAAAGIGLRHRSTSYPDNSSVIEHHRD